MKRATFLTVAAGALALAVGVGCGSAPVPAERIASSESAVRAAREVGAEKSPAAALHLRLAQDQLAQAKQLIADGDNKRAEWVLLRAESDAELAVALSREAATRTEAEQALEKVKALKTQSQNNQIQGQKGTES